MPRSSFATELAKIHRDLEKAAPRSTMVKSTPPATMDSETFLLKATYAASAGMISGVELAELKYDVARNRQPDADLVKAVVGGGVAAGGRTLSSPDVAEAGKLVSADEFLAKAMDLYKQGKLTSLQIAEIEQSLNMGQRPAARLARAVESGREPEQW